MELLCCGCDDATVFDDSVTCAHCGREFCSPCFESHVCGVTTTPSPTRNPVGVRALDGALER